MKLLTDCLNAYLADTPFPGLEFEALEKVEFGKLGGVISPGKVLLEVTFSSRWKVPRFVGERELREAEMRGYERAVSLLRQTGREQAANELGRAYMVLQESLPPVETSAPDHSAHNRSYMMGYKAGLRSVMREDEPGDTGNKTRPGVLACIAFLKQSGETSPAKILEDEFFGLNEEDR